MNLHKDEELFEQIIETVAEEEGINTAIAFI
jgi:hypothetical protein